MSEGPGHEPSPFSICVCVCGCMHIKFFKKYTRKDTHIVTVESSGEENCLAGGQMRKGTSHRISSRLTHVNVLLYYLFLKRTYIGISRNNFSMNVKEI